MARKSAAVFLDRDNTLIHADADVGDPQQVRLIQGAASAIASLRGLNYKVVVVSNQGGVARGKFDEAAVESVHEEISRQIRRISDSHVDRYYYCPYHPHGTVPKYTREHPARKPQPGMLLKAADDLELDLGQSWMVGDQLRDVQAGHRAGVRTILLREDVQSPDPTGKNPGVTPSTTDEEWQGVPDDAVPEYIARNLVEAVRIIAQQRRPESAEDQRAAGIAASKIKRWEPVPLAGARKQGEGEGEAKDDDAPPAGTSHAVHVPPRPSRGAAGQPRDRQQSPPLRPSGIAGYKPSNALPATKPTEQPKPVADQGRKIDDASHAAARHAATARRSEAEPSPPESKSEPPAAEKQQPAEPTKQSAPEAKAEAHTPEPPKQQPVQPTAAKDAPSPTPPPSKPAPKPEASPAKPAPADRDPEPAASAPPPKPSKPAAPSPDRYEVPSHAPPPAAPPGDPPQREHLLRQILQELRNVQAAQAEFSTLQTAAVVLQVIAAVCLVGALWMGAAEIEVFVRWLGAGVMVQLAAITLLIFRR